MKLTLWRTMLSVLIALVLAALCVAAILATGVTAGAEGGDDVADADANTLVSLLPGSDLPQPSDDLQALVEQMQNSGLTVLEAGVVPALDGGIPAGVAVTVRSTTSDPYEALDLFSRAIHEVSYAVAVASVDAGRVDVIVVDPEGALLAGGEGPGPAVDPLPLPLPASDVSVSDAGIEVQDYLASSRESRFGDMLEGLAIRDVAVSDRLSGRTLKLDLVSDGTEAAAGSLGGLIRQAAKQDGWVSDLNGGSTGLGLIWVHVRVSYPDGTPDLLAVVDSVRGSIDCRGGRPSDILHAPSGE